MKCLMPILRSIATCGLIITTICAKADCPPFSKDLIEEVWNSPGHAKDINVNGMNYTASVAISEGNTLDSVGVAVLQTQIPSQNECEYVLYPIGLTQNVPSTGSAKLIQK